jgi:hypothetical protein
MKTSQVYLARRDMLPRLSPARRWRLLRDICITTCVEAGIPQPQVATAFLLSRSTVQEIVARLSRRTDLDGSILDQNDASV